MEDGVQFGSGFNSPAALQGSAANAARRLSFPLYSVYDPYTRQTREEDGFAAIVQDICAHVSQSPTGHGLLFHAVQRGVHVGQDPLLEPCSSFFYAAQNRFDVGYQPAALSRTEKGMARHLIAFIAGLRRAWHLHKKATPSLLLAPSAYCRHFRLMEADIEAITHLIAWELRTAGHPFLWRALVGGVGDIANAFGSACEDNPKSVFDGAALKAAFNQWFAIAERVNACDHLALEIYDYALLQRKTMGCVLTPDVAGLARLGLLPARANYLEGCSFTGVWYDGMDDSFNRAHLAHIERDLCDLAPTTLRNAY